MQNGLNNPGHSVHSFRRRHHLARPLAAWLLLWFVLMAAAAYRAPASSPAAAGGGHHAHAAQQADPHENCHDAPELTDHAPAQHAVHCPVCLHAAAPPSLFLAVLPSPPPAARQPGQRHDPPRRVHTSAPAPARGPPAFS